MHETAPQQMVNKVSYETKGGMNYHKNGITLVKLKKIIKGIFKKAI